MVFNSLHFAGFFLACLGLYRLLPHRGQNWLLVAASYYFYASWDWRFLGLLVVSTLTAYACGVLFGRLEDEKPRRLVLYVGLGVHPRAAGCLQVLRLLRGEPPGPARPRRPAPGRLTLQVLLPVGISFYTFIAMSYVIDVHRRQIEPCRNLVDVAAFIGFFPTLLAGPIVRASSLLRQIREPRSPTGAQVAEGAWLMLWGYFKKMFVADNLAHVVNQVYAADAAPGGLAVVLATVAFAFQIYGDFSGYSDIARGAVEAARHRADRQLPVPRTSCARRRSSGRTGTSACRSGCATTCSSRSASRSRAGSTACGGSGSATTSGSTPRRRSVTMLLAGLWHGAAWTFVLWGAYQGALLISFRLVALRRAPEARRRHPAAGCSNGGDAPAALVMFALTCYGWLMFRADSLAQIAALTGRIFTAFEPSRAVLQTVGLPLLLYAGPLVAIHAAEARRGSLETVAGWPRAARYSVYVGLVYAIVLFGDFQGSDFIYFQF